MQRQHSPGPSDHLPLTIQFLSDPTNSQIPKRYEGNVLLDQAIIHTTTCDLHWLCRFYQIPLKCTQHRMLLYQLKTCGKVVQYLVKLWRCYNNCQQYAKQVTKFVLRSKFCFLFYDDFCPSFRKLFFKKTLSILHMYLFFFF